MRSLAALLMTGLLSLPACTILFDSEAPLSAPGNDDDAGPITDCVGLSLLQDDFSELKSSLWWQSDYGGGDVQSQPGSVTLTTGTTDGERGALIGTNELFGLVGTLAIQLRNLDLNSDLAAEFYIALDGNDRRHVASSISGGTLSVFSDQGPGDSRPAPAAPFWLLVDISENNATLSYWTTEESKVLVGAVPINTSQVELIMGLSAHEGSQTAAHSARIEQVGDFPGSPCGP